MNQTVCRPLAVATILLALTAPTLAGTPLRGQAGPFRSEEAAWHDSLIQVPPRFRADWLKNRGLEDPFVFGTGRTDSTGLRLVGKYGRGPSREVTGQDSLLFLSNGSTVAIFSIADPGRPILRAEIQARSIVAQAVVQGRLLYIGDYAELSIWDVSDPTRPGQLSVIPYGMRDFALSDSLLAFTHQDTFRVYSVADPANPQELGILPDSGTVRTASGSRFILNSQQDIVYIIDCSDPTRPRRRGSYPGYTFGLAARGDICYAAVWWHSGQENFRFDVLDISNPDDIRRIGQLADVGGYDIHLDGPLAFVSGYQSSGFEFTVVSIADSTRPMRVGQCGTPGDNDGVWGSFALDRAYVADRCRGLTIINISDLNNPVYDTSLYSAGYAEDISVDGNLMYVASNGSGLHIIDIANPAEPKGLSILDSLRRFTHTRTVVARDSFAFIEFGPSWFELRSVDVSDPANPVTAGGVLPFNPVKDLVLRDTLLFTAQANRFEIYNVARPREPVLVGSCEETGISLWLVDTLMYIGSSRPKVVNVADPTNPHVVGAFGHPAWNLVVSDTVAFLSAGPLVWYNVADPTAPVLMDSILLNHTARGLAVVNNIAYVSALNQLHAVNVANLHRPEIIATVSLPYTANRIIHAEPYLYLSCWDAGVSIYETVSVGIAEPERAGRSHRGLQVSPNPTAGRVVLTSDRAFDGEVMIRDVAGRVIAKPRAWSIDERRAMVNLAGLPAGVYFVELKSEEALLRARLVRR